MPHKGIYWIILTYCFGKYSKGKKEPRAKDINIKNIIWIQFNINWFLIRLTKKDIFAIIKIDGIIITNKKMKLIKLILSLFKDVIKINVTIVCNNPINNEKI